MVLDFKSHIDSDKNLKKINNHICKLEIDSFLVGGYVRDLLLSKESKDVDIMTLGDPYTLTSRISKESGFSDYKIFKNFGTASINYQSINYEFVGARKESYTKISRNPRSITGTFRR